MLGAEAQTITGRDGVRITFDVAGNGPPIVLLHGLVSDRSTWRSAGYLGALADDATVISIDGRGRGASDKPASPDAYSLELQVDDVIAVLDHLQLQRAALLGMSLGGIVALHALVDHPDRIERVVAIGVSDAPPAPDPAAVDAEHALWLGAAEPTGTGMPGILALIDPDSELPEWMRNVVLANDPRPLAALTRALGDARSPDLATVPGRTALICGDQDESYPAALDAAQRLQLPLTTVTDADHLGTFLATDQVVAAAKHFLSTDATR